MKKKKTEGFTLVELLVTILIISIILGIGGYLIIQVINNSKNKATDLSMANILNMARVYMEEYSDEVVWQQYDEEDKKEQKYSCVAIEELINKNLLKSNVKDNYDLDDYVVVSKDNNNVIVSEEFDEGGICSNSYVKIPTKDKYCNYLVYNGLEQQLTTLVEDDKFKFLDYKAVDAGNYGVRAILNDDYHWEDGTTSEKVIYCSIKRAVPKVILEPNGTDNTDIKVGTTVTTNVTSTIKDSLGNEIPVSGKLTVKPSNSDYLDARIDSENPNKVIIEFLSSREIESYVTVTFTPDDTKNYYSSSAVFTVGKPSMKEVPIPTAKEYCVDNLIYNQNTQSLIKSDIEHEGFILYNTTGVDVGDYTITARLKYGYSWKNTDNDTSDKTFTCSIKPNVVDICEPYTNYYFLSTILQADKHEEIVAGDGWVSSFKTTTPKLSIDGLKIKDSTPTLSKVCLVRDINDTSPCEDFGENTEIMTLFDYYSYYLETVSNGKSYTYIDPNSASESAETTSYIYADIYDKTRRYISHGRWYDDDDEYSDPNDIDVEKGATASGMAKAAALPYKVSILADSELDMIDNPITITVNRTVTKENFNTNLEPFSVIWPVVSETEKTDVILSPALYKIEYDVCDTYSIDSTLLTVTYNNTGGTGCSSKKVNYGSTYGKLCTPTRTGYTFDGWYTNSSGGSLVTSDTKVTKINDHYIYARWKNNTYKISYALNGGSAGSDKPTSVNYGEVVTISNPTKQHIINYNTNGTGATLSKTKEVVAYTFDGWTATGINTATAKYGTSISNVATSWNNGATKVKNLYFKNLTPSNNGTVKLTANWKSNATTLPSITKTGYTCNWNTNVDGSGTSYNVGDSYTPTANTTLYANCTANTYTITLDNSEATTKGTLTIYENYGSGVYLDSALTKKISMASNPITLPERTNYKFRGYYAEKDGQGNKLISKNGLLTTKFTSTLFSNNTTLYPEWVSIPTITCDKSQFAWSNTVGKVKVSLTNTDNYFDKLYYKAYQEDTYTSTLATTLNYSKNGIYYVYVYTTDDEGNVTTFNWCSTKFDNLKPYTPYIYNFSAGSNVSNITENCSESSKVATTAVTCNVTVTRTTSSGDANIKYTISQADQSSTYYSGKSGIAKTMVQYTYKDGTTCSENIDNNNCSTTDRKKHVYTSYDNAGNVSSTLTVNVTWK